MDDELRIREVAGFRSVDRDDRKAYNEFRGHMRRAYTVMRKRDAIARIDEIDEHVQPALRVEGRDQRSLAASIRTRRLLRGGSGRATVTDEQRRRLRRRIGDKLFEALEAHDDLLDAWASDDVPGRTGLPALPDMPELPELPPLPDSR